MSLQLSAGKKKLKVNIGGQLYQIKNNVLEEALKWVGLIKESKKTLVDVPEELRNLVDFLIAQ